ncbi:3,6-diketocamphane 1,6-monooxygenase [Geodia barretti]|uniref:3,6-diketocamphane 1,6-monooxygenase n=1 Tax=Geodia barretti TaxID=519541 RepID=A0AA35X7T2_GEOBA|nr:3,6-diketocamphane 1,6-monooxygenase [Geodia barretti]
MRTTNIKLGTGAHLLPFHNPVELAHRVAYLDHLAQGRYMFGIGSGGLLSDHELFDVNFEEGEHHARTREALEIILGIWGNIDGSFDYEGKFWNDVTLEYLVDNLWIVGSPDTVARKLRDMYEMVGGFGTLLWLTFDHSENREAYEKAMTLMATEVMPQLADLTGE